MLDCEGEESGIHGQDIGHVGTCFRHQMSFQNISSSKHLFARNALIGFEVLMECAFMSSKVMGSDE